MSVSIKATDIKKNLNIGHCHSSISRDVLTAVSLSLQNSSDGVESVDFSSAAEDGSHPTDDKDDNDITALFGQAFNTVFPRELLQKVTQVAFYILVFEISV